MSKLKLKEGDVFNIPLNGEEIGFGQIIAIPDKSSLVIVLFDKKQGIDKEIDFDKICGSRVIMLGNTFDAKLYHKDWQVIGNYTGNINNIAMPVYRLGTPPGDLYLTDYKGNRLRKITLKEFEELTYQIFIAPVRYENALRAYFGLQEWKSEDYDKLLYTRMKTEAHY